MNTQETGGVYRRCGCTDLVSGRCLGGRCPKLVDPAHGSWYYSVQLAEEGSRPARRLPHRPGGRNRQRRADRGPRRWRCYRPRRRAR